MKIRLNKKIGIAIIILSGLNLLLFLSIAADGQKMDYLSGLLSVAGIWVGVLYIKGFYFEIIDNNFILKALIGSSHKSYPFSSNKDFTMDGNKVTLTSNEKNERLPIYAWMADKSDWIAFKEWLNS